MNSTTKRLSGPIPALSFEEEKDLKAVKAVIYLLRVRSKRPSAAIVQKVLLAAFGVGMRKQTICAHMKRLFSLETQGGNRSGTNGRFSGTRREPILSTTGTIGELSGTKPEHRARVVNHNGDINKNVVAHAPAIICNENEIETPKVANGDCEKISDEDALADEANDLADRAFKATLGFTDEKRRANRERFASLFSSQRPGA